MIDLYTWSTPNGIKISIVLEELGLNYRVHPVNIVTNEQFEPSFLEISPNNKIPAIVDQENGRSLMESGAILCYLAKKGSALWGSDVFTSLEWLMMQMGSVGPMLGQAHHFLQFNRGVSAYAEERYRNETHRIYSVLNKRLEDRAFLATEYGIADIATWPWISRFQWHEIDWTKYPNLKKWYLTIAERPAVRRGYHVPKDLGPIPLPE